jgi:OmpA-OmpF porin, OOP family
MKKTLLLAAAITMASTTAIAQTSLQRFYLGAGTGKTRIAGDVGDRILPVTGATASTSTIDLNSTPARAFAGFRFSPHWGIEAGAQSLGRFEARRDVTLPAVATYESGWTVRGVYTDIIATMPIGDALSISGKLGAMRATTRVESIAAGVPTTASNSKFAFRYGVALQVDLNRWLAFRGDAEVNRGATNGNVGGLSSEAISYNVFTGSLILKF